MGQEIRLAGRVIAVSDPPPGSAVVEIEGKPHSQTRDGWIDLSIDGRTVRATLQSTPCRGETDRVKGGWRDLNEAFFEQVTGAFSPFTAVAIASVVPRVGDLVEVYGTPTATVTSGESGFRDAPASSVTKLRALLVGRNTSLDDAIAEAYPEEARGPLRDQRPTAKNWLGTASMLALAAISFVVWRSPPVSLAMCACALMVRPRLVRAFRSGADEAPYSPRAFLYNTLFPYSLPGMVLMVAATLQSERIVVWFIVGCFVIGIWLGISNRGQLAPYRRLLAAQPWTGGDADEVRLAGPVTDPTPAKDGAAIAREETWDRGSAGGSDPAMRSANLITIATYTILASAGDVVVDPAETQWASSVVVTRDAKDKDQFILTESIPVGAHAAAVGSIVGGKLRSKGTSPALVLATSKANDPLVLARSVIRHDQITLIGLAVVAVLALLASLFA